MRIGEFSKKYDLTIDTVRHYMDLELLLPDKKGGHYFFSEKEIADLKKILELKELRFTLSEIQRIVVYTRLSQLRAKEDKEYIKKIFRAKKNKIEIEKEEINRALDVLDNKINEFIDVDIIDKNIRRDEVSFGIPLDCIQYLGCPICNESLELEDGKIVRNMVIEGHFKCTCGYGGDIKNGIYISLDDEDKNKIPKGNSDEKSNDPNRITLSDYVEETDASFVNRIYKSIDTVINFMDVENINNKIILELGTGTGLFIRQFISYVKPQNMYIITDHDINKLMDIKLYVQKHLPHGKFVFLCTDLSKLPIKTETIDYAINYATSLTYNLTDSRMLESLIIPKIRPGGKLISSCSYVNSGSKLLQLIPEASRKYYEEKELKKAFAALPLKEINRVEMSALEGIESKYEVILNGTKLYTFVYCGQK